MKHRSIATVILLSMLTFGIYSLIWHVKTKNEMNRLGARIPTAWLILLPFVGPLIFKIKWCQGVNHVSSGRIGTAGLFFSFFVPILGEYRSQSEFNQLAHGQQVAGHAYPHAA